MKQAGETRDHLVFEDKPTTQLVLVGLATLVFAVLAVVLLIRGIDAGVVLLVFAISGPVYVYFFVETRSIRFDRALGQVTLRRRGLRGVDETVLRLDEVARVEVHTPTADPAARVVAADTAPPPGKPLRPVLVRKDGKTVPLVDGYSAGSGAVDMARSINRWLIG